MRRGIAVTWHVVSFLIAATLYFFFVLPRWPELMGDTSHTLGTAMRIISGALFGLSALPVVATLHKARRPEFGNPQLALSLLVWSIVGHVTAGVLIVATAIAEIWLDLDDFGGWLFAVYAAAAAIALLGAAAFYLAFTAQLPPPPPKPLKPKKEKASRRGKAQEDAPDTAHDTATVTGELTEESDEDTTAETAETEPAAQAPADGADDEQDATAAGATEITETPQPQESPAIEDEPTRRGLRNRRRSTVRN